MMRWCAYCQEFQGEVAPLDLFTTTHGICPSCLAKGMPQLNKQIPTAHRLRAIQGAIYEAGQKGDVKVADVIIRLALDAGLHPVDILVGIITPLLYRVGNEWAAGDITIADQQRFSRFCEHVYDLIRSAADFTEVAFPAGDRPSVFLLNVPGNDHSLGIRILSLWLQSKGVVTREISPPRNAKDFLDLIKEGKPAAVLVSLSMASQRANLAEIVRQMQTVPPPRPALIVGGYAVKRKLIAPLQGALFVETLTELDDLIRRLQALQWA